jgi:hypothetical protein
MELAQMGENRRQLKLADEVEQNLVPHEELRPMDLEPLTQQLRAPTILAGHTTDAQQGFQDLGGLGLLAQLVADTRLNLPDSADAPDSDHHVDQRETLVRLRLIQVHLEVDGRDLRLLRSTRLRDQRGAHIRTVGPTRRCRNGAPVLVETQTPHV